LARGISSQRINDAGQLERRQIESLSILREHLKALSGSARLCADWLLGDPVHRNLTPNSQQSLTDYIEKLVQGKDDDSRSEALFFADGDEKLIQLIPEPTEKNAP
jgi:hypothetical protein